MTKNDNSVCTDNTPLSSPHLPDASAGSSVSSGFQNEYDDLLKFTLVIPQFNPTLGPQVLENAKGLFLTTSEQVKIRQEQQQPHQVTQPQSKPNVAVKDDKNEATPNPKKHQKNEEKLQVKEEEYINDDQDTFEGMSSSLSSNTTLESFSPHCNGGGIGGLLMAAKQTESNARNYDNNLSITTHDFTIEYNRQSQCNYSNNNDSSSSSVTTTTTQTNDINPRKHSPVPMSPPVDIDFNVTAEQSIDALFQTYKNYAANLNKNKNNNETNMKSQLNNGSRGSATNNTNSIHSLDKWFKEFKTHVVSEFEKSRLQIVQEQQRRLIEEKEKQTVEITKLQKDIESMRKMVADYEKTIEQKDSVIENLSKALDKQREKSELQKNMMEWKVKKMEANREAFTMKIAEKYYQQRMKTKIFLNWHILLANRHKIKVEKACKKKAEEICLDLANQYEAKIKKLDDELRGSHHEIEQYKYEMAKYEENMKRALMRGVCALNLEAMSIFAKEETISNTHKRALSHQQRKSFNSHNLNRGDGTTNVYHSDDDLKRIDYDDEDDDADVEQHTGGTTSKQRVKFNDNVQVRLTSNDETRSIHEDDSILIDEVKQTQPTTNTFKYVQQPQVPIKTTPTPIQSRTALPLQAKVYQSLTEHTIPKAPQQRVSITNLKNTVKPKVNTHHSGSQNSSYPYRSIIIEKHKKDDNNNDAVTKIQTPFHSIPLSRGANLPSNIIQKKVSLIKCPN